jgi:hypothetical protein
MGVIVGTSGRGLPPTAHTDARGRKTQAQRAHDHGPCPGRSVDIRHCRPRILTRHYDDTALGVARQPGVMARRGQWPASRSRRGGPPSPVKPPPASPARGGGGYDARARAKISAVGVPGGSVP